MTTWADSCGTIFLFKWVEEAIVGGEEERAKETQGREAVEELTLDAKSIYLLINHSLSVPQAF